MVVDGVLWAEKDCVWCSLSFSSGTPWIMPVLGIVQAPLQWGMQLCKHRCVLTCWPGAQDSKSVNVNVPKREGGTASVPATLPSPAGEGLPVGKGALISCFASIPSIPASIPCARCMVRPLSCGFLACPSCDDLLVPVMTRTSTFRQSRQLCNELRIRRVSLVLQRQA